MRLFIALPPIGYLSAFPHQTTDRSKRRISLTFEPLHIFQRATAYRLLEPINNPLEPACTNPTDPKKSLCFMCSRFHQKPKATSNSEADTGSSGFPYRRDIQTSIHRNETKPPAYLFRYTIMSKSVSDKNEPMRHYPGAPAHASRISRSAPSRPGKNQRQPLSAANTELFPRQNRPRLVCNKPTKRPTRNPV